MNKKILIGAGIVALLLLIGGFFFFTKSSENTGPGGVNNNPFGTPGDGSVLTGEPTPSSQTPVTDVPTNIAELQAGLIKISSAPVSDGSFFEMKVASGTTPTKKLRFIERATGHVFEADLGSGSVARISNTTIPKIEVVSWGVPGTVFLGQYIDEGLIKSKVIEIGNPATTSSSTVPVSTFVSIAESPLIENILSFAFDKNASRIFYLTKGAFGAEGFLVDRKGAGEKLIWEFPTTEWIAQWFAGDEVLLTSKAGNGINGFAYLLNTKTGSATLTLADIPALTTKPSPSGKMILYTSIEGTTWETYIYNTKEKTHVRIPYDVIPEKCVWTKDELSVYCARPRAISKNAPDDWYQGLVSFSDTLWRFDFVSGTGSQVSELNPGEDQFIDLLNPHISGDETYIAFTNKKDLSFWALPLK